MECVTIWIELASAIGTIGATVVALWLALSERRQRIDCAFMWESATNDKPTLIINNIGKYTVIIESVEILFHNRKIGRFDILRNRNLGQYSIITPGKEVRIALDSKSFHIEAKPEKNPDRIYKLTAVIKTTNGKKYKSSYKYCYTDLEVLAFFSEMAEE